MIRHSYAQPWALLCKSLAARHAASAAAPKSSAGDRRPSIAGPKPGGPQTISTGGPKGLADRSSDTPHFTFYDKTVEAFADRESRPITIQDTFQWSPEPDKLAESARYLHQEIPIRTAQTVKNFQVIFVS